MNKKIVCLFFVVVLMMSMCLSVSAATTVGEVGFYDVGTASNVTVVPGTSSLLVTYSAAKTDAYYGIILVEGNDLPTKDNAIFYVDQLTANSGEIVFNVLPKLPADSCDLTLYISSNVEDEELISIPLKYSAGEDAPDSDVVSVTGVSLNKTSTTLEVGESETLTATVLPSDATNKNVSWSSSDASVASVLNGVVTANAAGTATITVTTADGSKIATCTVTVTSITEESSPSIEVNNTIGYVGKTVDVVIDVSNNPGIAFASFDVDYNSSVMTLKAATLGDIFTGELDCNLEKVPYTFNVYSGSGNKTENGTLLTLQFEIKSDCAEGDYNITLSNVEMIDIDKNAIEFLTVNGKITVRNSIPGDVNGDGSVTRTDLLRLAKHFSGFVVEIDEAASDVTGDGNVTRTDLLRLAKHFSGFDVVLGK